MPKKKAPEEKLCKACGDVFLATTTYQRTKQKFCGRLCRSSAYGNGRAVELTDRECRTCEEPMLVLPCHVETKFYCSVKCRADDKDYSGASNPAWKGGTYNNGQYWKKVARQRDDYTCQQRGCDVRDEGKGTHAHHIVPASVSNDHSLSNLVTLCATHHHELERELFKALAAAHPRTTKRLAKELYPDIN